MFYDAWLHCMLSAVRLPSVTHTAAPDRGKLVTLVAGKRRPLLFTGVDDEVFMTRILNVTPPKTKEQDSIVRFGKCEAAIINNKRLRSRYCIVEANYPDMKHRAASLRQQSYLFFLQLIINRPAYAA